MKEEKSATQSNPDVKKAEDGNNGVSTSSLAPKRVDPNEARAARRRKENGAPELKPLTIDEFIEKGYLLRALDLPAEGCNTLLTTLLPEDDIPVVPEDRSEAATVQRALKKIVPRASNTASLSHQDRIDQI